MARSPNYPGIDIREAVESARTVYIKEHRNTMNADVVAQDLGYSTRSGSADRRISALRQYGLLVGRADDIRISDDAIAIIVDEDTGSQERAEAIVRCSENPQLFQDIKSAFPTVPSHANLRAFLEKRKFTRKAADKAAEIYRATMEFVESETSGYNNPPVAHPATERTGQDVDRVKVERSHASAPQQIGRPVTLPIEDQGLSEIEYIRVSKECGIRLYADGPYRKRDIEKVVSRLKESLDDGVYDELEEAEIDDDDLGL